MNAYLVLEEVRASINEVVASHWTDVELLNKINRVHRSMAQKFQLVSGDWLLTSKTITPTSGVVVFPSDCFKPVYMEEVSTGRPIPVNTTVRERRLSRPAGSSLYGGLLDSYLVQTGIEINQDSYSEPVKLWYQKRVPDLATGTDGGGGDVVTLVLESAKRPSRIDDYYNGSVVEAFGGTGSGTRTTISDYVGSTLTVTTAAGTFGSDTVYGTESLLPSEDISPALISGSIVAALAKPGAAIDPKYFTYYSSLARKAMNEFEVFIADRLVASSYVRITGEF